MTTIKYKRSRAKSRETSPAKLLESELEKLRRDLRATVRAYAARLEIGLAESRAALESSKPGEELSRERLQSAARLNDPRAQAQIEAGEGAGAKICARSIRSSKTFSFSFRTRYNVSG